MPITTITTTKYHDDGSEEEVKLPAKFVLCDKCRGKGTHVNPNIDGHGITQEEWERDLSEEEKESYLSGDYDVTCYKCNGEKVTKVVDEKAINAVDETAITPALKPLYDSYLESEREKVREARQAQRDFEMGY